MRKAAADLEFEEAGRLRDEFAGSRKTISEFPTSARPPETARQFDRGQPRNSQGRLGKQQRNRFGAKQARSAASVAAERR